MSVKSYYSVSGDILGERTGNAVRTDYLRDALGSVSGTMDSNGKINSYRYKPYGSLLEKVGNETDPKFLWVGTPGYREAAGRYASNYVRFRHFDQSTGRWLTVDPLWPDQMSYVYVNGNPTNLTDPFGLAPCSAPRCCCCPFGSVKLFKKQGNPFPILDVPDKVNSDWRGHHVIYQITLVYFTSQESAGSCRFENYEAAWLNGNAFKTVTWDNSDQKREWEACLAKKPQNCNGVVNCQINDYPGYTPWTTKMNGQNLEWEVLETDLYILSVTELFSDGNCACPTTYLTWDQTLHWKAGNPKPTTWLPENL